MSASGTGFVQVALPVPVRRPFTYRIEGAVPPPGTPVVVPFRNRTLTGWTLGPGKKVPGVRDVIRVSGAGPALGTELLALGRWIADYYVAPVGIVLRTMLPTTRGSGPRKLLVARVTRDIGTLSELDDLFGRAPRQRQAFERLLAAGGTQTLTALEENGFSRAVVKGLEAKGLVTVAEEVVLRDPFRGRQTPDAPSLTPTPAQNAVLKRLTAALGAGGGTFLLHGVTGSGKTLVYIELIRRVLADGLGAIVLVPEIALTPQTVARFRAAFGDRVAVLHSGLSDGERFDAWTELRAGRKRIAVGARSAVFAPLSRVGAIVVDEEHDGSYKQSETPRYSGRDVAVVRANHADAVCVLGSATPSLESWANAKSGKYALLELPDRVGGGTLPRVHVADLRSPAGPRPTPAAPPAEDTVPVPATPETETSAPTPPEHVISPRLLRLLRQRLERREQTILLLNRRGYATFAQCRSCGDVLECVHCSVSMTLHRARRKMICHHCGHLEPRPRRCARCGSTDLSYRGLGTEQVERILIECLPGVRVARMDVDTTGGKWSHHDILERVRAGEVDILLGTQMIAKGLDFPRVTLVGVINADVGLHLPDFRSSERTFQLLSQVAGRAGRGRLPGEVVIQTHVPDHHVVRAAVAHDYHGFVDRELASRADPAYPPRVRMARILLSSPVQADAMTATETLHAWLGTRARTGGPEVLGPAPAPIERLQGRYRWHLLLRGSAAAVGRILAAVADEFRPPGADLRVSLDRDPLHLM
ncbi:MAG: primosomal protein N' [Gemmatimonadetes bacterium]|nr:primosomal protein N' [Gemmatimonadota bacterium]